MMLSAMILALGVMFLFFGGTWDGVRFGLEILGAVFIFQIAYKVIKENESEKQNKAAAGRARKAINELKKIVTDYKKASVEEGKK